MKNANLLLILLTLCGCGIRVGTREYLRYTVETQTPIYYSFNDHPDRIKWKELPANGSVEFRETGELLLSRSTDSKDIFYTLFLPFFNMKALAGAENFLLSRSSPTSPQEYYYMERILLNNGWARSYSRESGLNIYRYKLTVDKAMAEGPRTDVDDIFSDYVERISGEYRNAVESCILVYMMADNDLYQKAVDDINRLESAYRGVGDILVHFDGAVGTLYSEAVLLRIRHDKTPEIASDIVIRYGEADSCSREHLNRVLRESNARGLVLWAHGSGWLPALLESEEMPVQVNPTLSRSLGPDEEAGTELDTSHFFNAVGDVGLEFILFDACRMSGVEVVSEVNSHTNMIAPVFDIPPGSFPYEEEAFLKALLLYDCQAIVDKIVGYNELGGREIFMTWKKTYPGESLPTVFENFLKGKVASDGTKIDLSVIRPNVRPVVAAQAGNAVLFYDFYDFVRQLNGGAEVDSVRSFLNENFYMKSTPTVLNGETSSDYCGLSCYIPYHLTETDNADLLQLNSDYLQTWWARKSKIQEYILPVVGESP